jgi:hypothetical protein
MATILMPRSQDLLGTLAEVGCFGEEGGEGVVIKLLLCIKIGDLRGLST